MKYTLFTYRGVKGLRKVEESHTVVPFVFAETLKELKKRPNSCIEITALIHFLRTAPDNRYSAYINLREMTDKTTIIVEESIAQEALSIFPLLFDKVEKLNDPDPIEESQNDGPFLLIRHPVYTYDNSSQLERIIEYTNEKAIPLATFSQASGNARNEFEKFNKSAELALMDLTSVSHAIENNKNLIYLVETFLNVFPNIRIICTSSQVDILIEYFPLYIEGQWPIKEILPEITELGEETKKKKKTKCVTDLDKNELESFFSSFEHNLIGHGFFKQRLKHTIKNFIALNKAKEQKVLSIFLFGASGIGKTEVARLLANGLHEDGYLAKINFQNYSSQDALNSLIGSPSGYIGCDHGELSDKIGKTKIGVLLCDEFEKTTRPVSLFFLELLEDGKFTDSMAREYNLDGFIIVFTSNLQSESEYKKAILPELQTRFDLVCEFEKPNENEKRKFLELLLEKAKQKHTEAFAKFTMTQQDEEYLLGFDCSDLSALRDIKRVFNNRLMDLFEAKGII